MPGMCSVPGCKGYRKARSRGVVFHSLPTRDPQRCRKWLQAIQSPKFDENTPTSKYGSIRVCSQHFKPEDYEPDIQAEFMKTTPENPQVQGDSHCFLWKTARRQQPNTGSH
ncbi:THAP domain-containing protein 1-like [Plectropomus leopardus]|uniref:THAP domain-containing protein 1-like n=1 Tax=Plectropomus leopardus TaxID=160734 RepID=UPI001C4B00F5|nr:THAP domain-containing protein 1-like [Plectropomus leopardus]